MRVRRSLLAAAATSLLALTIQSSEALQVNVTIDNVGPVGGVGITPVWVGFHSGSFDSYNGGLAALEGLERLAEDGDTSLLSAQFNDFDAAQGGYTYVQPNGPGTADDVSALVRTGDLRDVYRVDGTIGSPSGPPPLLPGESASASFDIMIDGSNEYFSYASMVLPSNDFFVANGNPLAHSLASLYDGEGEISFLIGTPGSVNDAGTEAEDAATSAANGLFGLPGGQTGPNQGADDPNPLIRNVTAAQPLGDLKFEGGTPPEFDFNDPRFYKQGGIARITISAVPEPGSLATIALVAGLATWSQRRRDGASA